MTCFVDKTGDGGAEVNKNVTRIPSPSEESLCHLCFWTTTQGHGIERFTPRLLPIGSLDIHWYATMALKTLLGRAA